MKGWPVLILVLAAVAGCTPQAPRTLDDRAPNAVMVNSYADAAVENAILAQHTLYPYHFIRDASTLNELGWKDVKVLAAYYKDNPGPLSIRRLDTPQALYEARVAEVKKALAVAGVKVERIAVSDSSPGGDGMTGERVILILDRDNKALGGKSGLTPVSSVGSGGSSGGSFGGSFGGGGLMP
jgi:hypothetical protein